MTLAFGVETGRGSMGSRSHNLTTTNRQGKMKNFNAAIRSEENVILLDNCVFSQKFVVQYISSGHQAVTDPMPNTIEIVKR